MKKLQVVTLFVLLVLSGTFFVYRQAYVYACYCLSIATVFGAVHLVDRMIFCCFLPACF